jgi:uncharacterized protein (DUF2461 family)
MKLLPKLNEVFTRHVRDPHAVLINQLAICVEDYNLKHKTAFNPNVFVQKYISCRAKLKL